MAESASPCEYEILNFWYKKKILTISELFQIDERYHRYLNRIICWKDNQDNDYTYIRTKIIEFINIDNNAITLAYKTKLMKYIDGEIMVMMNLCLLNDATI
jgi:hypothetical protein